MSITRGEVEQVARLAKLALSEEELGELTRDLGSILDHMTELDRVDADTLQPMGGVSEHPAPFREDAPGADRLEVEIDRFAPGRKDRFFTVPRLAALDADALAEEGSVG